MTRRSFRWLVAALCVGFIAATTVSARGRGGRREGPARPLARSAEDAHRREPPHERPGEDIHVHILRLQHIPAESFMEVLEQLGRAPKFREMLEQIPVAMNEHANAIVIIGPPKVMELFERIAEGLDAPSEFHERMRDQEMGRRRQEMEIHTQQKHREMEMRAEMAKRELEMRARAGRMGPPPWAPGREGDRRGEPDRPRPREERPRDQHREERPRHEHREEGPPPLERLERALRSPGGEGLERLLSPQVMGKLRLAGDQVDRIRRIAKEHHMHVAQLRERVGQALKEMGPDERERAAGKIIPNARRQLEEMAGKLREEIGRVLRPEQREVLERILHGERPPEKREKREEPKRDRPKDDREPRRRGKRPERERREL